MVQYVSRILVQNGIVFGCLYPSVEKKLKHDTCHRTTLAGSGYCMACFELLYVPIYTLYCPCGYVGEFL